MDLIQQERHDPAKREILHSIEDSAKQYAHFETVSEEYGLTELKKGGSSRDFA